jgi:hypothetical protein
MRWVRFQAALAALVVFGGLTAVWSQDRVLVPGDPPLTRSLLEKRLNYLEWLLDTQFTASQRTDYQRLFMQAWRTAKPAQRRHMDRYMTADAERLEKMGPEERVRQQQATLLRLLPGYEKSTYPGERWIAKQYQDLYKPGGANNPIRVGSDPPLTQRMLDLETAVVELLLDLRFSGEQRQKHQQLLLEAWKKADQDHRVKWVNGMGTWARLPAWGNYRRSVARAFDQPNNFERWRKGSSDLDRWLAALYEASFRPGSARNPILVESDPPLTQLEMDRYGDFLQVMLDTSMSGGFTRAQREVLQEYLVKDWKSMSPDECRDLFADVERWFNAAAQGSAAANKCIGAIRPKLLTELYTRRDKPRHRWLIEVLDQERQLVERSKKQMDYVAEQQKIFDEMLRTIGPHGHWVYDGNARRNVWVPDR